MARTILNTRAGSTTGSGDITFQAMDKTNGNRFVNTGLVVPLIKVAGTSLGYVARFRAQVSVSPDGHFPHRDVILLAGSKEFIVELLDRYFFNNAEGYVEIDWLNADLTAMTGTPAITIDLVRVANL